MNGNIELSVESTSMAEGPTRFANDQVSGFTSLCAAHNGNWRGPDPLSGENERREPLRGQLARNLRLCRIERDMSQADLAEAVGLSRALINRIESGRFAVSLDALERLAETFAVEPALLIGPLRLGRPILELRALRESRGFSQSELALRSGVSRVSINRIENGKASASPRTKRALARALGVHPATIS